MVVEMIHHHYSSEAETQSVLFNDWLVMTCYVQCSKEISFIKATQLIKGKVFRNDDVGWKGGCCMPAECKPNKILKKKLYFFE